MRTIKEWIGKTDDTAIPARVKIRIIARQSNKCFLSGIEFRPGDKIEFDHATALWLGGENRESNLRAVLADKHKEKTRAEAPIKAKVQRMREKHHGIRRKRSGFLTNRDGPLKQKMNGEIVRREC